MASSPHQAAFDALRHTIRARQALEAEAPHDMPEYAAAHPTTIDFPDVHGFTLLRYAIRLGNLETVKELEAQGASLSQGLWCALGNNQLDIARYLFEKGADYADIKLSWVQKEPCRTWFAERLRESLFPAKPPSGGFFTTGLPDKKCLKRAAELGMVDYLRVHARKEQLAACYRRGLAGRLACYAAANNQVDVLMLFKAQGHDITPTEPWQDSPLLAAVQSHSLEAAAYLLNQGADPDYHGRNKRNALMTAVDMQSPALTHMLLSTMPDVLARDYQGQTALHLACRQASPHPEIVFSLLSAMSGVQLTELQDIFGLTPLDYAREQGNTALLHQLGDPQPDTGASGLLYDVSQFVVLEKIKYYLLLSWRGLDFYSEGGHCGGFNWLHDYYVSQGKEAYYFDTLKRIADWDGSEVSLDAPFDEMTPQAEYYQNLRELMEQWSNDLIWFQHSAEKINDLHGSVKHGQHDRRFQYQVAGDGAQEHLRLSAETVQVNTEQLLELMEIVHKRYPKGTQIFLDGSRHIVSISVQDDQKIAYYDANFPMQLKPFETVDALVRMIVETKHLSLKHYEKKNGVLYFNIRLGLYYFNTQNMQAVIRENEVFSDSEMPQTEEDVIDFQKHSPNRYTPMHVAILSGSLRLVQALLDREGTLQQLNKTNHHGFTPLESAIEQEAGPVLTAVLTFFEGSRLSLENLMRAQFLRYHYLRDKPQALECLLPRMPLPVLQSYFLDAVADNDTETVARLLAERRVDLRACPDAASTALIRALDNQYTHDALMLTILLENGASLLHVPKGCPGTQSPLLLLACRDDALRDAALPYLHDVNARDSAGNALIHFMSYMTLEGDTQWLPILLKNGNFYLKNGSGKTVFQLTLENEWTGDERKFSMVRIILEKFTPDFSDNKLIALTHRLMQAAMLSANLEAFQMLLDIFPKAHLNRFCHDKLSSGTLLHWSVFYKRNHFVHALLHAGADVNIQSRGRQNTCLHLMVSGNHIVCLDLFHQKGAQLTVQNEDGETVEDLLDACTDVAFSDAFYQYWSPPVRLAVY